MPSTYRPSRGFVIALSLLVVALAGLLAARFLADRNPKRSTPRPRGPVVASRAPAQAPPARVPPPRSVAVPDLPYPYCWTCPLSESTPLTFKVDLDLVAPLGDGPENAAIWFRDFSKRDGARADDNRRPEILSLVNGRPARIYAPDDPILAEAEPWVDQARMRFYPDVWPAHTWYTPVPGVDQMVALARSWVARGQAGADAERAKEDFRRAIRLGRLMLQDDVVLMANLAAFSCIRLGAEALYRQAHDEGDAAEMVKALLVLADLGGLREKYAVHATRFYSVGASLEWSFRGPTVKVSDSDFQRILEVARRGTPRSLRIEAQGPLYAVKAYGSGSQRKEAAETLESLKTDADPLVAESARAKNRVLEDDRGVLRRLVDILAGASR